MNDESSANAWQELLSEHRAQREEIAQGGGEAAIVRQHEKGRLTARERIAGLIDPGSEFLEIGRWAAWGMYEQWGPAPAASVICGLGRVEGRSFMVIANDATVKAGAFYPMTAKKVLRAQRIAMTNRLPLIYLVDSAGVLLPMQDEIFPDEDDFGRIFRNNAVLSAMGVTQLAAIMGNCVAGGGYLPVLCDKLVMTEGSGLYLAGPALVQSSIGQTASHEELGGAEMHAAISGTIDFREPDDESCLARLRALAATLPHDAVSDNFTRQDPVPPARDPAELTEIVTPDPQRQYEIRDVIDCIVDAGSFQEYKAEYGKTMVCGYARIGGQNVGIVSNQHHPEKTDKSGLQFGGVVYHESADKAARFVMDCNQTWLPIVFLQDVYGFMVGRDSEQAGIIRAGAKLVSAISNSRVPKLTVVLGGSYGAGNYALCGKAFDPRFIFAWPTAHYAVMGAGQAASTILQVNIAALKRQGQIPDADEMERLRQRIVDSYEEQTDIRYAAARGWVDEIIEPANTRAVLIESLAIATRHANDEPFRTGVYQV
ncbi:Methylmalonyl-CoA carboxyltransferase 12S subunit [Symmachiella macrocystis]|uniref:Methylmalonyl-CoA carboxyltransferase 12S subunit n=1 Tax=Symmachiella macrocystis TaxID=2527985 RepID=A0A5C6BQ23_9PLAN|nr:acyl-CoA carboxylase subunit beta [Symmachiella macrocystis]TWU13792.1 Methylmalonyl-CoA carboxyltransferase 12S subunit [Symmachiella macrocystis]